MPDRSAERTVTRRTAIATTTLTAIGAGLMGVAGTRPEPAAAEPAPLSATVTLVGPVAPPDAEWFAAWRRRLHPALAWAVCVLRHRAAHRWYPRYLAGYGACSTCGRGWA